MAEFETWDAAAFRRRIVHAEHRQLFDYWLGKKPPGGLPARADLDPLDVPGLLPRVALIEVLRGQGAPNFRYRLAGTEIVGRAGRDPTGKRFDELYEGVYLKTARSLYSEIVRQRTPHLSERTFPLVAGREFLRYDRLILPLARDHRNVDMMVLLIAVLAHGKVETVE